MRTPPPDVLESWPEPNHVNPETRGDGLIIVNVVTITVAGIVVLLRLYTRIRITGSFGFDDLLILFALVRIPKDEPCTRWQFGCWVDIKETRGAGLLTMNRDRYLRSPWSRPQHWHPNTMA